MNFYELLKARADDDKIFLRVDAQSFGAKQFLSKINDAAARIDRSDEIFFIDADRWIDQAVQFFAAQAVGRRPLLLHRDTQLPSTIPTANPDDAFAVLSSGSSGAPKILFRTFDSWASFFSIQNKVFGINHDSAVFIHGSLSFTGNLNVLLATMSVGGSIVTSERLNARHWLDLIDGCSTVYLVPTKLNLIASTNRIIESVNTIFTGSQLVSDRLRVALNKTFPNARLIVYYGAGELNYVTYKEIDGAIEPNNVGRAFDGVNVEIRGGLICVDSPWHVSGLKTPCTVGDAGRLNDKGELIFEGRGDDFINKGGYKISCARLESVLSTLDGIEQAAVIKIDDRRRGDDFVFVIQSTERERAVEEIKKALPPIERTGKIIFVDEMPLNDRGKVDRHVLRSKFM
ncbi:MAG: AMP-binding protein [Selenomonadaceae bacterium]|nr:AMP-binding protein [Selenomonadaceae bacterium]